MFSQKILSWETIITSNIFLSTHISGRWRWYFPHYEKKKKSLFFQFLIKNNYTASFFHILQIPSTKIVHPPHTNTSSLSHFLILFPLDTLAAPDEKVIKTDGYLYSL